MPTLETLARAHRRRLYHLGRRHCRSPHDADDAVQEAFTRLARRPDVVAHPGALAWLMTTVRHLCLRFLAAVTRRRTPPRLLAPAPVDEALALQRALAALDPEAREMVRLRDVEGRSTAEVSAALGLREAAVKSRLHRARARLRRHLGARPYADDCP
jgi:RNA polymerase sigma-70 factor (ECF subfamily)